MGQSATLTLPPQPNKRIKPGGTTDGPARALPEERMLTEVIRYVTPSSTLLRPLPSDLLDHEMAKADPRHKRLFVAAMALSDTMVASHAPALKQAHDLYNLRAPGLLDRPTRLTVASIIGELEQILGS
jgi:hypothetical protein